MQKNNACEALIGVTDTFHIKRCAGLKVERKHKTLIPTNAKMLLKPMPRAFKRFQALALSLQTSRGP